MNKGEQQEVTVENEEIPLMLAKSDYTNNKVTVRLHCPYFCPLKTRGGEREVPYKEKIPKVRAPLLKNLKKETGK